MNTHISKELFPFERAFITIFEGCYLVTLCDRVGAQDRKFYSKESAFEFARRAAWWIKDLTGENKNENT